MGMEDVPLKEIVPGAAVRCDLQRISKVFFSLPFRMMTVPPLDSFLLAVGILSRFDSLKLVSSCSYRNFAVVSSSPSSPLFKIS